MDIGLSGKLNYGYSEPFFDFNCVYKYFAAYLPSDTLLEIKKNVESISIKAADFMLKRSETRYLETSTNISSVNSISEDELLEGRLPSNDNEILISTSFAVENEILNGKYSDVTYSFLDIYNEKYENTYSDMINLYDYFPNGIEIVGIVADSPEEIRWDIYISSNKWNQYIN